MKKQPLRWLGPLLSALLAGSGHCTPGSSANCSKPTGPEIMVTDTSRNSITAATVVQLGTPSAPSATSSCLITQPMPQQPIIPTLLNGQTEPHRRSGTFPPLSKNLWLVIVGFLFIRLIFSPLLGPGYDETLYLNEFHVKRQKNRRSTP